MERRNRAPELDCAKCGSCSVVCPVYQVDGRESMTARGKMHLLTTVFADQPSPVFEDLFSRCLLCGACEQVCPRNLPITDIVSAARSRFSFFYGRRGLRRVVARSILARSALLDGLVRAGISLGRMQAIPESSGLRITLGLLEERSPQLRSSPPQPEKVAGTGISYFTGCLARYLQPSVVTATKQLLAHCGLSSHEPDGQVCCGLAAWSAGKSDEACRLARKNIAAFSRCRGVILTSCASCFSHLHSYPDLFEREDPWHRKAVAFTARVREFSSFFSTVLPRERESRNRGLKIFYHDPCHLRYEPDGRDTAGALLAQVGLKVVEPENGPSCCGQGGLFHLGYPEISEKIFQKTSCNALAASPDCITTSCSGCLMQYRQGLARQGVKVRVVHLAQLLSEQL